MRTKLRYIAFILIFSLIFCGFKNTSSEVDDGADAFSSSEINELNSKIQSLEKDIECQVVVVTVLDNTDADNKELAEKYYKDNDLGYGNTGDCVVMLLNLDESDRAVYILAEEKAADVISDSDTQDIIDSMYDYLVDGDYYEAADEFVDQVDEYYDDYDMGYFERSSQYILYELLGALVIAGIVVFFMIRSNKSKMTVNNHTYLKNNNYHVHDRRDMYINTTVVKRKINTDNNGGGHGGGGGGGGHSSGGGRNF